VCNARASLLFEIRKIMTTETQIAPARPSTPKAMFWTGWVLTILLVLLFLMGSVIALTKNPQAVEGFKKYGYPEKSLVVLGIVELVCALLYVLPMTSMLGAILLTGYLGGAVATHVRAGEPFFFPILFGIVVWLGLYFRDARVRSLIPLRTFNS